MEDGGEVSRALPIGTLHIWIMVVRGVVFEFVTGVRVCYCI